MRKQTKSQTQRDLEFAAKSRVEYDDFKNKLESVRTMFEAIQLSNSGPPPNAPGRKYYSNFSVFLNEFGIPIGSSNGERSLYIQLIERLEANRQLKEGEAAIIVQALRDSISINPYD